ncbi:ABC transporter permease [Cytophagaceae bacterium DM2B3-1]|uniref:ABC transporter permease n=1 Tax=Xanthocytophaga flava TaxID=3048013 RepID=A0ABT7CCX2_9BACT|nr:ABC transporter permease [Xanthocytophaga flavus]MDJ1491550.1 ABC transporter permease [Xanthocytophaga flavus]
MLQNYLTIALRNLRRHKAFSAINIFGLAIGIATCLLITLYVLDELTYDRHFSKADRIYRMGFSGKFNGQVLDATALGAPLARQMRVDYPEVEESTRLRVSGNPFVTYGNRTFKEDKFVYVDSNFFQVFDIPFLKGDPKTALSQPNTMVITQATARKYFGNQDPMGKMLQLKSWNNTYKVTGVIEKVPANTHFHFDLFATMLNHEDAKQQIFANFNFPTYIVLKKGYDYKQLEAKLPTIVNRFIEPEFKQYLGATTADLRKADNQMGFFLQPLTDIHLHSHQYDQLEANGDIRYVYIFSTIAGFMLLIACINFMNLSTAGAAKRAKEVGIRKVLGSVKEQLVGQFLSESMLLAGFALLLAVLIVIFCLPAFNSLTGKTFSISSIVQGWSVAGLAVLCLLVGLLAGSYPAFFLSSFKPIAVLKGGNPTMQLLSGSRQSGLRLRSVLVVFQFFISIILLVGTTVVYQQLTFMQNKKIGFDKAQVIVIHDTYALRKNEQAFRNQLLQDSRVVRASISDYIPVGPTNYDYSPVFPEDHPTQNVVMGHYRVDEEYMPTLGMELAQGRNFSRDFGTDSLAVIINESAVKSLGWQKDPLGKKILRIVDGNGTKRAYTVIGVVKDFHFKSLHEKIGPLIMIMGENSGSILVKVKTKDIADLLASFKKQWSAFPSDAPFGYSFIDQRFESVYRVEQKIGQILGIFASLTIFIACLGLFGLATFTAQQRNREFGIRKVLGASVTNIIGLLSKDFLALVLTANLIAWPIAYYAMNRWLEDFAYRISIAWWVFALAAALALLITLVTVSYQAVKAALANPVTSLKTE